MGGCCALGCKNSTYGGKRLFRVPTGERNAKRREAWLRLIGRSYNYKDARLCEDHFEPDQFENHRADGRRLLKGMAVPTIHTADIPESKRQWQNKDHLSKTEEASQKETEIKVQQKNVLHDDVDRHCVQTVTCEDLTIDYVCDIPMSDSVLLERTVKQDGTCKMVFIQYAS
ncbi:uncharacterized protein LOC135400097 [Ornithodoros turicata]|uniref:uncharacterized protein LOC135400097 n=1 Tax=Ornithodoros turicata TaxID=34597 RepID=UPI0031391F7C